MVIRLLAMIYLYELDLLCIYARKQFEYIISQIQFPANLQGQSESSSSFIFVMITIVAIRT